MSVHYTHLRFCRVAPKQGEVVLEPQLQASPARGALPSPSTNNVISRKHK
jgi:hypothetical protein